MKSYNSLYNPYDGIDHKIRDDFMKTYCLELNGIHYNTYGIVDDFYLLNLIGESKVFNVFLGYKEGVFAAVKIMKRSVFDSKDILSERIRAFHHELELRKTLNEYTYFPQLFCVNREKYIVYEEYCNNGNLTSFSKFNLSEKAIKYLLNKIILILNILKSHGLEHSNLNAENVMFDHNFKIKVIGFRLIQKKLLHDSIWVQPQESEFIQIDCHIRNVFMLLKESCFNKGKKFLSLVGNSLMEKEVFFLAFNEILEENKYPLNTKKELGYFIYSIKLLNTLDYLDDLEWINKIAPEEEYMMEMYEKRQLALPLFYEGLFLKEEKLLAKKKGLFKVLK
jgi:serine/threonine protein kinase